MMARALRLLLLVLLTMLAVYGTCRTAQAALPQGRQSFSIRVAGKIEVVSVGRQADGSAASLRVTSSERVEVRVERRPSDPSVAAVSMQRFQLTTPNASLNIPAADITIKGTANSQSSVIVTIVPF